MVDDRPNRKKLGIIPLERRLMLDASLPLVAGQVLWLDAADATTILDADGDNAATGTGGAGDGFSGTVATWLDKSTSGYDVAAPTASEEPVYTTAALNGNNVLTFDGSNDRLINTSASIPGDDFTVFFVFNRTTATARDAVMEMSGGSSRNAWFLNEGGNGKLNYYLNGTFYAFSSTYTTGTYELVTAVQNTADISLFLNAANELSTTGGIRASTTELYIGDDSTSGDQLRGNIAEILVYDHDLTANERHDIENYLATKWGLTITDAAPSVSTNTGLSLNEGLFATIGSTKLSTTDADNSTSALVYTLTDITDHGTLENNDTMQIYGLGDTFTQDDIDSGYITYTHDGTENFTDSFSFTVSDGYTTTGSTTFNISITPVNEAPVIDGWTLVSSEDFESGATGWSDNTTEDGGTYLTNFLGRHSQDGGLQNVYKTYTLSGTQDYATISFDLYELDSWDYENFGIFVDDVQVFTTVLSYPSADSPANGSSGNVSWMIQETTAFNTDFVFGSSPDQRYHVVLKVATTAASLKLGFTSTLNSAVTDEAWGIDNILVNEVGGSGTSGPFAVSENSSNSESFGIISATDPEGDTLTYSITGGTGAGIFALNASTGVLTVVSAASLNYETTPSYTLDILVTDSGGLTDTETITINVIDVPENTAPVISAVAPVSVNENVPTGTHITTVSATDPEGDTLTYSITAGNTGGMFAIDPVTGEITTAGTLNFESVASYTLTVRATDDGFGHLYDSRNITISVNNVNEAPSIEAWTLVSSEDFESGATGWSDNTTTNGGTIYTSFLGRHSLEGGAQNTYKTYTLSGTQNYATIEFDLYEIDSWDGENFIVYVNDVAVLTRPLSLGAYNSPADGSSGNVSWTIQETTPFNANFAFSSNWADQRYHVVMTVATTAASLKLGFSSTLNQAITDEAWGVDNIIINEVGGSGAAGPFEVSEKSANGDAFGRVFAKDPDTSDTLTYSITGGTGAGVFAINSSTGVLTVSNAAALDYETTPSYTLDVLVTDNYGLTDTATVTVNLIDVPENTAPVIAAVSPVSIDENVSAGTHVATVSATDAEGDNITYSITAGNTGSMFAINATTGEITTAGSPDYEAVGSYTLTVRATDNGFGNLSSTRTVTVSINDVNEAPALDAWTLVASEDFEGGATGWSDNTTEDGGVYTTEFLGRHSQEAGAQNTYKTYTLSGTQDSVVLSFNMYEFDSWGGEDFIVYIDDTPVIVETLSWSYDTPASGSSGSVSWTAYKATPFNAKYAFNASYYDQSYFYTLTINTTASTVKVGFSSTLDQAITDESWGVDNILLYEVGSGTTTGPFAILENSANGSIVGTVTATDPDAGDTLTYSITGGTGAGVFAINGSTGAVTVSHSSLLNYEANTSYTLDVLVTDSGGLTDATTITVNVLDMPENTAPVIAAVSPVSIDENIAAGTHVVTAAATDAEGDTLTYSITAGNTGSMFAINAATGEITTAGSPNYEALNSYTLTVQAIDNGFGNRSSTRTITVSINNVNETPSLTGGPYSLVENSVLGTSVGFVAASDPDIGEVLTYSITGGTGLGGFAVNSATGEITLSDPSAANYELSTSYTLDLLVQDVGGLSDTITVTINITDANDTPSDIALSSNHVDENSAIGTSVGFLSTTDEDPTDTHTYSIVSNPGNKFILVGNELVTDASIDYEVTQHITLVIRADDGRGGIYDEAMVINIGDEMDTYVPPPDTGAGTVQPVLSGENYALSGKAKALVRETLSNGELGEQSAFYGLNKMVQIIREKTTAEIRTLLGLDKDRQVNGPDSLAEGQQEKIIAEAKQDAGRIRSHYTNLRHVLEDMQKFSKPDPVVSLSDAQTHRDMTGITPSGTDFDPLAVQFVDVMTYHEQKQARLRQVLMG